MCAQVFSCLMTACMIGSRSLLREMGEGEREGEGKGETREGGTVPVGLLARNTNQTEAPRQGNSTRRKKGSLSLCTNLLKMSFGHVLLQSLGKRLTIHFLS